MPSKTSPITALLRLLPFMFLILTGCGGGGSGSSGSSTVQSSAVTRQSQSTSELFISGAGIKGPLAYATVGLYSLDARFDGLYDPQAPLAVATTNAYAEISGLKVPDVPPPYILVIDGSNAIDLDTNSGVAPVITKLVTVITPEALQAGQLVYVTPYTTLAYHMLQKGLQGGGLHATYYNGTSFTQKVLERTDDNINFNWGSGSPAAGVDSNNFSVRWTGTVKADHTEDYTFYTSTDDGVRLWVDGNLLIDRWHDHAEKEYSATVHLTAGKKYPITMEYYDHGGDAVARLRWSSASQPKTVIAGYNLYSMAVAGSQDYYPDLVTDLAQYNDVISRALGFGMSANIDIFTTPPIITEATTTVAQQDLVVNYRAAIEALSSMVYQLSQGSAQGLSTDTLLERIALDLYSDGVVDNSNNGQPIGGVNITILSQDPMPVAIPNTDYRVRDILSLIDDERALVGSSTNVPFYKDKLTVSLRPALLDSTIDYPQDSQPMNNTVNSLLMTGLIATTPVTSNEIYRMDLSAYPAGHALTREEAAAVFHSPSIITSDSLAGPFDAGNIRVVNDPFGGNGKVLSIQFRGGTGGIGTSSKPSGGQWKVEFGGKSYDELYMDVELGVDNTWISPKGMHLPALTKTPLPGASGTPNPDMWALNMQLCGNNSYIKNIPTTTCAYGIEDDSIALYYYTMTEAQKFAWFNTNDPTRWHYSYLPRAGQAKLARNSYVKIESHLKLNSVPSYNNPTANGVMQGWFNGQLAVDRQGFAWRRDASQKMKYAWILFWTGGGATDPTWFQPQDQKMYMRSLIISTKPITH